MQYIYQDELYVGFQNTTPALAAEKFSAVLETGGNFSLQVIESHTLIPAIQALALAEKAVPLLVIPEKRKEVWTFNVLKRSSDMFVQSDYQEMWVGAQGFPLIQGRSLAQSVLSLSGLRLLCTPSGLASSLETILYARNSLHSNAADLVTIPSIVTSGDRIDLIQFLVLQK